MTPKRPLLHKKTSRATGPPVIPLPRREPTTGRRSGWTTQRIVRCLLRERGYSRVYAGAMAVGACCEALLIWYLLSHDPMLDLVWDMLSMAFDPKAFEALAIVWLTWHW